jgi:hypothetical protein
MEAGMLGSGLATGAGALGGIGELATMFLL